MAVMEEPGGAMMDPAAAIQPHTSQCNLVLVYKVLKLKGFHYFSFGNNLLSSLIAYIHSIHVHLAE